MEQITKQKTYGGYLDFNFQIEQTMQETMQELDVLLGLKIPQICTKCKTVFTHIQQNNDNRCPFCGNKIIFHLFED